MISTRTFRPMVIEDVSVDSLREIGRMHLDYVRYSRDTMLTVPQVFDVIRESVSKPNLPFQFWIARDGEKIVAFALTQFKAAPKGVEFDLSQIYISPPYRNFEFQKFGMDRFEEFARSKGCYVITASTLRDPMAAFIRWTARVGFKKVCVIVEKDLRKTK